MASIWVMDVPTIVFARIVNDFSEELKLKYGMQKITVNGISTWRNFSTSQVSETPPIFPYITLIESPGQERGQDLEGNSINAAVFTFQVDIFCNDERIAGQHPETVLKNCMAEIIRIMKTMRFRMPIMASFDSKPQEYRMTARFSRIIGAGDIL